MSSEVVAEIEEQVEHLRAAGKVPPGLEDELAERFEEIAEASLAAVASASAADSWIGAGSTTGGPQSGPSLAQLPRRASMLARKRLGPSVRRLERRATLGAARAGEAASTRVHVTADRLERLAAHSPLASRALSAARAGEPPRGFSGALHPTIEGPLLAWVLEHLGGAEASEDAPELGRLVLHAECGDGRVVEALAARGLDARGADPRRSSRASGDTNIAAAGALEYLGATPNGTLDGLLLSGVVDQLRPGAARALAHLAASRLKPGGVVVLVSARPEATVAIDPVAADLAPGRPLHPVTWCHLLARYGLTELGVFEPDATDPDVFAVSALRPLSSGLFGEVPR